MPAVGRPRGSILRPWCVGDAREAGAIGVDDIHVRAARPLAEERDTTAVWRPARLHVGRRVRRQAPLVEPVGADDIDLEVVRAVWMRPG